LPRLQALPGVESVAATSNLPMTGSDMVFNLMFYGKKGTPAKSIVAGFRSITPEYFKTLKMPLLSGRDLTAADNQDAPLVGIANQALVKQMWGTENPIGKKMPTGFLPKEVTIIGVVPDMLYNGLDSAPKPELFVPYAQKPWGFMRLAIRTRGKPMSLATALAQQVRAIDPGQSVDKVRPFADILRNSAAERNFYMLLLTIFAGLALALAAVGVFGVISYAVTQRTHEIGVRIALGASAQQIMAMVLRKGMLPAAIGLAAGLGCAAALNRVMRNLLFGIKGTDPLTFAAVALVLVVAATAACYLPARRATRVDPMRALRYE
jgi:putative ABC transport system permease protein